MGIVIGSTVSDFSGQPAPCMQQNSKSDCGNCPGKNQAAKLIIDEALLLKSPSPD